MGSRQRLAYWAKKCLALLLVVILFALVGIIASQAPRSSYAQTHAYHSHTLNIPPTDTTTPGTMPTPTPTDTPTPTPTDTPTPTPVITPINQGTPTPTPIIIYPTPTVAPPTPTPTPTPGTQAATPTPTAIGNRVPTPTPTANGAGGVVPPGAGQQATPGLGTPTPTPGPSPSPSPTTGAATQVPTSAATAIPTTTNTTTQGQQSGGSSSNMLKIALGFGAALMLVAAALAVVMWKRQTHKNVQILKAAIPLPTYGQQSSVPWMNRSEVEAAFRTSPPPANDYAMYAQQNQQNDVIQMPPAMAMAMAEASASTYNYGQEQGAYAQASDAQNVQYEDQFAAPDYQQDAYAQPPAQGSRLLSQAKANQKHTPLPPGNEAFNTPEPSDSRYANTGEDIPSDNIDDPFIDAMIRQAQMGIFVLPGKPVPT